MGKLVSPSEVLGPPGLRVLPGAAQLARPSLVSRIKFRLSVSLDICYLCLTPTPTPRLDLP